MASPTSVNSRETDKTLNVGRWQRLSRSRTKRGPWALACGEPRVLPDPVCGSSPRRLGGVGTVSRGASA